MLEIAVKDYMWSIDRFFDTMVEIVTDLGDDLANTQPDIPGANSPYALVEHCIGLTNWWGGRMIAGREVVRDRDAEFTATGEISTLADRVRQASEQFDRDLEDVDPMAPPESDTTSIEDRPQGRTKGGVMLHIFNELSQHLGHLEITRDVLLANRRNSAT